MSIVTKTTAYVLSLTQPQADILANILIRTVGWDNDSRTGKFASSLYGDLATAGADDERAPELEHTESGYFKEAE